MKLKPLLAGTTCRNSMSASKPPADAPIATTHGDASTLPPGPAVRATLRGRLDFIGRRGLRAALVALLLLPMVPQSTAPHTLQGPALVTHPSFRTYMHAPPCCEPVP